MAVITSCEFHQKSVQHSCEAKEIWQGTVQKHNASGAAKASVPCQIYLFRFFRFAKILNGF